MSPVSTQSPPPPRSSGDRTYVSPAAERDRAIATFFYRLTGLLDKIEPLIDRAIEEERRR